MVAIKDKVQTPAQPFLYRLGIRLLMLYWILCGVIYFTVDLFTNLYTSYDFATVAWYSAAFSVPLAALTLYYMRKDVFSKWYTYILAPLIAFGLYLGCTYFNALNLDIILSTAFKPATTQMLPVEKVNQVFARKIGFIHTDVALTYQGKTIVFQGTRTSYFLLREKHMLKGTIGRSYFGNYFVTGLQLSSSEHWRARWAYIDNWFHRYLWLLIALPVIFCLSLLKDRFFPARAPAVKPQPGPYRKFFRLLFIIVISMFGLFMLVLLLAGLFL